MDTVKRNETFINLSALILVALLAVAAYLALTDSREGLSLFSAGLAERVSYKYLLKITLAPDGVGKPVVLDESGYENGAANIVSAIAVDYRLLDTFAAVLFIFAASAGVALLMEKRKKQRKQKASSVVQTAVPVIMLFILVIGFHIMLHGHLEPGGGFAGGAVITLAFILQFLAFNKNPSKFWFTLLESLTGLGLMAVGLAGLFLKGALFANFLPTGSLGATISAGGIMIVHAIIGIKAASELSSISADFIGD
ncbi:hypothetical protein ES703_70559 [subsurface metagenome]